MAYSQGDYGSARTYQEESQTIFREIGDPLGIAHSLNNLGLVACAQGDYASSRANHEESLAIRRDIGDSLGIANSLEGFAALAAREHRSEQAAVLWAAAEALREQIDAPLPPGDREAHDQKVVPVRQALGEEAFSAAWAAGAAMTIEQAMDAALQVPGSERHP